MKFLVPTLFVAFLFNSTISKAQTAVDFTANDCSSTNHNLFTELDAGKIIVLCWVMPCGSCTAPALSAYTEVQNYAISNPGVVKFYVVDDYANTSCATLTSWSNTNGIMAPDAIFSNSSIDMADYGTVGMPKTVILGGVSHAVLFNQNNSLQVNNFNAAIAGALSTNAIVEPANYNMELVISPNPSLNNVTKITYTLNDLAIIQIDLVNSLGQKVKSIINEKQQIGEHEILLNTVSIPSGIYTVVMRNGNYLTIQKLIISK